MNLIDNPLDLSKIPSEIALVLLGVFLITIFFAGAVDKPRWVMTFVNRAYRFLHGTRWVTAERSEQYRRGQLRVVAIVIGGIVLLIYTGWLLSTFAFR
ncbi:MAG: hypothetical protein AMXMBFR82_44360 [Candidatus Hydrogenedentota bacterium]